VNKNIGITKLEVHPKWFKILIIIKLEVHLRWFKILRLPN